MAQAAYSGTSGQASNAGITQRFNSDERYIPPTIRKDGSVRPERKVRAGYIPPEDVPRYQTPAKQRQLRNALPPGSVIGLTRPLVSKATPQTTTVDTAGNNNSSKQRKDKDKISAWEDDEYETNPVITTPTSNTISVTPGASRTIGKPSNKSPLISRGALSQVQSLLTKEANRTNKKTAISAQVNSKDTNKQQPPLKDHKVASKTESDLRKRIKALEKKLRQANELKDKASDTLLPEQKAKIDQINLFQDELKSLETKLSKLSATSAPPITSAPKDAPPTKDNKDHDDVDTIESRLSKLNFST